MIRIQKAFTLGHVSSRCMSECTDLVKQSQNDPDLPLNDSVVIDDTTDLGKKERVAKERNTKECAMLQAAQISDANEMGKAEPSLDTFR